MLMFALVAATFVAVYWFWIRPVLKMRPAFRELYEREEGFFVALRQKFAGIKQKLSSAIVVAASVAVSGYDFIAPIVSGVDVSSIADRYGSDKRPIMDVRHGASSTSDARKLAASESSGRSISNVSVRPSRR